MSVTEPEESYLSGRFSAHWEGQGRAFEDGPRRVSAQEAIDWGLQRAEVVLIRPGEEGYYSAGDRHPGGEPLWPPPGLVLQRRRAPSMAYYDRTESDGEVLWRVQVGVGLGTEASVFSETFAAAIADATGGSRARLHVADGRGGPRAPSSPHGARRDVDGRQRTRAQGRSASLRACVSIPRGELGLRLDHELERGTR